MGAFPPFSEGISQASQIPDLPRTPAPNGWGIVAPFVGHHLPLRAPKSASPGGMHGKGRVGSVPAPLPAALGFAGTSDGEKVFCGHRGEGFRGCLSRVAALGSGARLPAPLESGAQPCLPAACHSRQPRQQGSRPERVPHPCHSPS